MGKENAYGIISDYLTLNIVDFHIIFINLFTVWTLRDYSCRNMLFNLFFSLMLKLWFARFYENIYIPLGFKSRDFDQSYTGF